MADIKPFRASVEAENQLQATLDEDEAADFSRIANRLS